MQSADERVPMSPPKRRSVVPRPIARSSEGSPKASPPGRIYRCQQRHPLRSNRNSNHEHATTRGGFGTSQPRDTLIHSNDHPHLTRSEPPLQRGLAGLYANDRGLTGLTTSVAERHSVSPRIMFRGDQCLSTESERQLKSKSNAVSLARDKASTSMAAGKCAHVTGAFIVGFTTAIAIIMLLGSRVICAECLGRCILMQQKPLSYVQTELWDDSYSAAVQQLRQRPPLAIIGGSGAEAGIDLASKVVAASQRKMASLTGYEALSADLVAPRFSLLSVPELGLSMNMNAYEAQVWARLRDAYLELVAAAVPNYADWVSCSDNTTCTPAVAEASNRGEERTGVIAIACVTLAYFEPQLEQLRAELLQSPLRMLAAPPPKLVSYPAAVGRRLTARFPQVKTVALLGSKLTLDIGAGGKSPFNCPASDRGARAAVYHCGSWVYEVPDRVAQERLQTLIFSIKRGQGAQGDARQSKKNQRDELLQLIDGLSSEVVVLACTELPLLLTEESTNGEVRYGGKILLDATAVLAEELASSVLPAPL